MKDKNYEGLANRFSRTGKVLPVATAVIFSALLPGLAIAEPEVVESPAGKGIILENLDSEKLALNSEQLSLDTLSVASGVELTAVEESETTSSPAAPTKLALAVHNDSNIASVAQEQSTMDAGSVESAGSESPQKPYALMLALVALISLVPMSRRHHE